MGFRLSDMISNAWFYKLKDMNKGRKQYSNKKPPTSQNPHNSKHYKAGRLQDFEASPRKSLTRRTVYKPSPTVISSASSSLRSHAIPMLNNPTHHSSLSPLEGSPETPHSLLSDLEDDDFLAPLPAPALYFNSYNCQLRSSTTDIIIDMQNTSKIDKADERAIALASSSRLEETKSRASLIRKEPRSSPLARKSFRTSPGIKLRPNSPKISSKKIQSYAQKSQSPTCFKSWNRSIVESFAVVKSSLDPQRDFKDSMIEMIVENNIRSSKELEHLLACYLSLNSNKYSDLIIKAFEQIWVDMTNPCL